jgi:hypothetical protein
MTDIVLRHDTATNWSTANPTLKNGEPGVESDTKRMKVGDGATPWSTLPNFDPAAGRPRVLCVGIWTCDIEADSETGIITLRAVSGATTVLWTFDPTTAEVTAGGVPLATRQWVRDLLGAAIVVGPAIVTD